MTNRKQYRAAVVEKKKLVKELFWINYDGKLDAYCRVLSRGFVRMAKRDNNIKGNVFDINEIQRHISYVRDLAGRACPDGSLLAFTFDEINEYHRSKGEEPWTREEFFGLDKKQRPIS